MYKVLTLLLGVVSCTGCLQIDTGEQATASVFGSWANDQLPCEQAIEVAVCPFGRAELQLKSGGAVATYGVLNPDFEGDFSGTSELVFEYSAEGPGEIQVFLAQNTGDDLRLFVLSECNPESALATDQANRREVDSRFLRFTYSAGEFLIVVDARDRKYSGPFSINFDPCTE